MKLKKDGTPYKIKPYGYEYYRRFGELPINISPCPSCNSPMISGYLCSYCGKDPTD